MNPATSHAKREMQTLRCCGVLYMRWRFVGKRFPGTHHKRCFKCSARLPWPSSYRPAKAKAQLQREWHSERSIQFRLQGLTTAGKVRQRPSVTPGETPRRYDPVWRRLYSLAAFHRRATHFSELGLNSRGQKRLRARTRKSELELRYEQFRGAINTAGISWDCIENSIAR